jgi:hypothetical protein
MKRIYLFAVLTVVFLPSLCRAQFTMMKDDQTFEIGGDIMAGYEYNFNQPGVTDYHKDQFYIDEARLSFQGRINLQLEYYLRVDFAGLTEDFTEENFTQPGSEINFLKEAYIIYKTKFVNFRVGYAKVPFSFNSLCEEYADPFLQRPAVADGNITPRRDLGVTLFRFFPVSGITAFVGAYSGMGETVFSTDNTTGQPEYAARVEWAYPAKYQREFIDWRTSPVPMFECGIGAEHAFVSNTGGGDDDLPGADDGIATLDGTKDVYGADASLFYKGFSLQVEADQMQGTPIDDPLLLTSEGTVYSNFKAGGYLVQLNYLCKPIKSVFAVRFDQFTPTNLAYGNYENTLAFAYNYNIRQNFLCLKIAYEHHFDQIYPANAVWKDDDLRAIIQILIN